MVFSTTVALYGDTKFASILEPQVVQRRLAVKNYLWCDWMPVSGQNRLLPVPPSALQLGLALAFGHGDIAVVELLCCAIRSR